METSSSSVQGACPEIAARPGRTRPGRTRPGLTRPGSGRMFDAIARRYDLLNRVNSLGLDRRWRRLAVAELPQNAGARILDLATGTADVALEVLRQNPEARVVGVDPSGEMLAVGRAKAARRGVGERLELRTGEAEALAFDDASFDGAVIAFGIRNVSDRPRALAELRRVVRPGGRVVILELCEPGRGPMAALARFHIHHVVPRIGAWLSGEREYRYLQASIEAFPAPAEFAAEMRAAGHEVLAVRPLSFGACCLFVSRPAAARPAEEGR